MLLLWILACAQVAAEPPTGPQVTIDESLEVTPAAAWMGYGVQFASEVGSESAGFEREVAARQALVEMWVELQAAKPKRSRAPDAYLDELTAVYRAGFLREYVWVFLRELAWVAPQEPLSLERFTSWKAVNLKDHTPQTRARVELPARAVDEAKAEALAKQASIAEDTGSTDRALRLASEALEADPDHVGALWTRSSAAMLLKGAQLDPDASERIRRLAVRDMNRVLQIAPQSFEAAVILQTYGQRPGLVLPSVPCPPEAIAAFAEAETHFAVRDLTDALAAYDRGLALCPNDANNWVYSGDALYGLADRERAIARYDKAIALVPCHWQAHRFRGDVLIKLHPEESRRSYVKALACNPGYDTAWAIVGVGRRLALSRPTLVDGVAQIDRTGVAPELAGVYDAWLAAYEARVHASDPDADFAALSTAVATWRAQHPEGGDGPWAALARAEDQGFLREAMFVHLFGADLIPAFLAHREAHLDRLEAYLSTEVLR